MFLSELMPARDALSIIKSVPLKLDVEEIPLDDAHRRVLAEDVKSLLSSPPFDKSAMDGYALRAEDSFGHSQTNPAHLKIKDRIGAGQMSNVTLKNGEAVKIATGAPIPEGADAVVMEEYTIEDGNNLEVEMSLTPGENVSPIGEDIVVGDLVLRAGQLLRPQDLAIIASSGYDEVKVFKKPKIGVITTGNELVMPNPDISGAEVINSNHYTVKALVEATMACPTLVHRVDNAEIVEEEFERMLATHDALITTGGTAISKGDVVVDVADKIGEVLIHGVALRPGKPFAFGKVHDKPVFMLSGYPVAAMVQFDVFIRQQLKRMQGINTCPKTVKKTAARKIASTLGRTDYIRAVTDGEMVKPLKIKGSGIIRSMVESNCYIIIEENLEGVEAGEECEVILYDSLQV
ncbi:molybdopterin molybdotransferase MoeA [Methanobacterium paludis]|uniref:Molybdenum cofactor synthesis domain protein n=1 Tax=Methanobacterium paludis (strain DSM 25820 / JCM 18151 / SWAN1) TaxID=868131 RepID=F6D5X7_METPW|nr:gephyrin-like molybdotransferase Glp [Methanobacterium paludis]AEG19347.1 molybdenum cofactor synthesis domain protein [Methanobacterium paludis]